MKIKTKKANAKDALKAEEIAEEKCWTRYCTASVEEAELDLMKATMKDQGEARLACFGLTRVGTDTAVFSSSSQLTQTA